MRRIPIPILSVLILCQIVAHSQSLGYRISVQSSVDTTNQNIVAVLNLWQSYLNSRPDSLIYGNQYWAASEQRLYKPFDLAANTWWGFNFYNGLRWWKAKVLSVSEVDDAYVIRTMFYVTQKGEVCDVRVVEILQVGARLENGSYKLCNVLPINTRYWRTEEIGDIRFVFPPDHIFRHDLAERASRFVDSLNTLWLSPKKLITYYFADRLDRVCKALGMDFWPLDGKVHGGFVDSKNRIIYSGGSDEWYPHEFVHMCVNPVYPKANEMFLEGYATLVGGSAGHDLRWHIQRNYEYLKDHPETEVMSFNGVDPFVSRDYFIGGLLCAMAEEKGGLPLVRKLMSYGSADEDFYRAILGVFGVASKDVNAFLRSKLEEFAHR